MFVTNSDCVQAVWGSSDISLITFSWWEKYFVKSENDDSKDFFLYILCPYFSSWLKSWVFESMSSKCVILLHEMCEPVQFEEALKKICLRKKRRDKKGKSPC